MTDLVTFLLFEDPDSVLARGPQVILQRFWDASNTGVVNQFLFPMFTPHFSGYFSIPLSQIFQERDFQDPTPTPYSHLKVILDTIIGEDDQCKPRILLDWYALIRMFSRLPLPDHMWSRVVERE